MYRLHYPDDPGMHNRGLRNHRQSVSKKATSFWDELKTQRSTFCFIILMTFTVMYLQVWNESGALRISLAVDESFRCVRKLPTVEVRFSENNHKLVYLVARLFTEQELSDPEYGVSVKAVKLRRRYEMYQWVEEMITNDVDGDHSKAAISYSYYQSWSGSLINSDTYNSPDEYSNPKGMPKNSVEVAETVKVGSFILCKGLIEKINDFQPFTGHVRPDSSNIKLHAGLYYHTDNIWNPQVGDIRVEFARAGLASEEHGQIVTIIAKQEGHMLNPYVTESGNEILILKYGHKKFEDVIHSELSRNCFTVWFMRILTGLLIFFIMNQILYFLDSMVYTPRLMRDILHLGGTFVSSCFTVMFYSLMLMVIYIRHRTFLGLTFFTLSIVAVLMLCIKLYKKDSLENLHHRRA